MIEFKRKVRYFEMNYLYFFYRGKWFGIMQYNDKWEGACNEELKKVEEVLYNIIKQQFSSFDILIDWLEQEIGYYDENGPSVPPKIMNALNNISNISISTEENIIKTKNRFAALINEEENKNAF